MLSPSMPLRRRQRSEYRVSVDDAKDERSGSARLGTSKRARTDSPDSELHSGQSSRALRYHGESNDVPDDSHEHYDASSTQYQPGAIVRVKVINFVTYEQAVFSPGPNLNMVIGPNGTGKSSLVCAICLGLGYGPSNLGRAQKVGEFVKHGNDDATIEIELQRRLTDPQNHIIKVRIIRDGDKRKWWINENETSLKAVQALTRELGIQVDNLCQFLPQDRVAEFAALNPVELLHHTQRAAAPEEMLAWHEQLKTLRKDQKSLQLQHESDQESLANQEDRQENLRADVERLQERAQVQEKIILLEKTIPFVEYNSARHQHKEHRQRKLQAQQRLKELEEEVEPSLRAVNAKQRYQSEINVVVKEREKHVGAAERAADIALEKIEEGDANIGNVEQARLAEINTDKKRKQDQQRIQTKIRDLEARLQHTPPVFEAEGWNTRIRAKEHRLRQVETERRSFQEQGDEIRRQGIGKQRQIEGAEQELAGLNSHAGRQVNKLRHYDEETARAWDWVQKNMDQFEMPIYAPPMLGCSVKDPRYIDVMESLFQKSDLISITTQTKADFKKLSNQVYASMKLTDVNIKCQSRNLFQEMQRRPGISQQQLQDFGLDGWASDLLEGPEPVIAMLCASSGLHSVGIGLRDVSEAQFSLLTESQITGWACGKHVYRTTRRAEYGPGATSTTARGVRSAQLWTDQPVDASASQEIERRIREYKDDFESLRAENQKVHQNQESLEEEKVSLEKDIYELKERKNEEQIAAGQYATIPKKIDRERESLQQKEKEGLEVRQRIRELDNELDHLILNKSILALEHKSQVERLRSCHEAYLEAEIRLAEAASDVESLSEHNSGIKQELEQERAVVRQVEQEANEVKRAAERALAVCKTILAEEDGGPNDEHYRNVDPAMTTERLEADIEAERSKLEFIHGGNAGALKEFEQRGLMIQKLQEKVHESGKKLERLNRKIADVRQKWEPELDNLIQEISDAFAYNFEQIGCAGEVGIHKDEDFDLWSIEIKVKFRENETLQLLDQHRQSGGERSVSTIFYLMSLQSLARAPFRVVDEINQGMDPRNERMVHERMVEIACKEHTSQYFLITPKLLTGLKYDARMKVLCIASGEYMPEDHSLLDIKRVIALKGRAVAAVG